MAESAQISYFIVIVSNMESASPQQQRSLSELPIGTLSHVSSYLSSLPRALLAVALDYYRDIDSSSAIVGDQQDVLDFGDMEKDLAVKLTDDDVRNILLSIDSINNLKALRLTNLLNITGIGLEPLRGSTVIEKIDLSLVRDHVSCDLSPIPPISTDVLPILDSIIDMGGECSLKLLIFPKDWRRERNTESEFHAFLDRYNTLLRGRIVTCLNCNDNLIEGGGMVRTEDFEYGTQMFTCFDCMKNYCHDCEVDENGENVYCMSMSCSICNRRYCLHCCREQFCGYCEVDFCVECMDLKECAQCNEDICLSCVSERGCRNNCCEEKRWCNGCVQHGGVLVSCENCGADCCRDCYDSNTGNVDSIDYCNVCGEILCGKCRVIKCKERMGDGCTGCYRFAFPALLEDKERKLQEMQAEIDEQKEEISELKEENGELKRRLEDLKGEMGEE